MLKNTSLALIFSVATGSLVAGTVPPTVSEKAATISADHAIFEGSFNTGFKANDQYFDANVNIVAPVWSTLGKTGSLGGSLLFVEPYVSWGDNGEVATSLGFGFRHLFSNQSVSALRHPKKGVAGFWDEGVALGGSFFVDMLDTEAGNQFWQLGVGAEVATRYVEIRGNYYIPTNGRKLAERQVSYETRSSSRTRNTIQSDLSNPYDNGQGLMVQDQTTSVVSTTTTTTETFRHIFERYEQGLKGWDIEVAVLVPYLDQWCDVKIIGGYLDLRNSPFGPQTGGTGPVRGWKAGVEIRPVPALAITGMWYQDKKFLGADWVVGARMEIPFEFGDIGDGKTFWTRIGDAFHPRRRHLVERLAEPVHRQNAAIKIGSSHHETRQIVSRTTTSNVQVVSQTKNQIILGPSPSGTEFHYVSNGTLTLSNGAGSGASIQMVSGALYLNGAGNSLLLLDNGGSALVLAGNVTQTHSFTSTGSSAGAAPPQSVSLGTSLSYTNTLAPTSSSSGAYVVAVAPTTPTVQVTPGNATLNLTGSTLTQLTGSSLTINSGNLYLGSVTNYPAAYISGGTFAVNGSSLSYTTGLSIGVSAASNITIVGAAGYTYSSSLLQVTNPNGVTLNGTLVPMGSYPVTNNSVTLPDNTVVLLGQ